MSGFSRKYPPRPQPVTVMPLFYYGRKNSSDRDWIARRMAVIPVEKQKEVAQEYSRLYLHGKQAQNGRRIANTYLQGIAAEYRDILRNREKAQRAA